MYLSRVELDVTRRSTMMMLTAPQKMHGTVESCFCGERNRKLWRIDKLGEKLYLLLLSEDKPDLVHVIDQFGTGKLAESKDYEQLLQRIQPGSRWQFRLTVNPTRSKMRLNEDEMAPRKRGKVQACSIISDQKKWLQERAEPHGFSLEEGSFDVTNSHWIRFKKGKESRTVSLLSVTYEGVLQITDAEKFCQLLTGGIGRGKAYGLGLMTVMSAERIYG